jgi:hypothetical protein
MLKNILLGLKILLISELAYKAMHKCKDMFDLIIPVYFESHLTFESFLLEMAKTLNLPIDEFENKGLDEREQLIIDTLGQGEFKHPLVHADNYESIAGILRINDERASSASLQILCTETFQDNRTFKR